MYVYIVMGIVVNIAVEKLFVF